MTWPLPVVSIATKLAYTFRRSAHQPDVPVCFVYIHDILVSFKHAVNSSCNSFVFIHHTIGNGFVDVT